MVSQPKNLEFRTLNSYLLHVLLKIVTKCLVTLADAARDIKPTTSHSREPILSLVGPSHASISTHAVTISVIYNVIHVAAIFRPACKHVIIFWTAAALAGISVGNLCNCTRDYLTSGMQIRRHWSDILYHW